VDADARELRDADHDDAMNIEGISTSASAPAGSFWAQLRPASYRGIAFAVLGGQARFGRRNAVHEYPFRDTPWIEDLGRMSRRIQLTAFLVGSDVISQRERLIAACEKPGDGELIHPTLGRLKVSVLEVSVAEHWEQGRYFEINFSFIEQGERQFPGDAVSSADAIGAAADTASTTAAVTFKARMDGFAVAGGGLAVPSVEASEAWTKSGVSAVGSATGLMNIATSLRGSFGRLLGQDSGISFGLQPLDSAKSIQDLIGSAAAKRESVSVAAQELNESAVVLDDDLVPRFSRLALAFALAVRVASFTPADALRCLGAMSSTGTVGGPITAACNDLFRRAAVSEMAKASAGYEPSTSDEAAFVRSMVLDAIDAEVLTAGNQGDDAVYAALRAVRAEVIRDMNAKGASLPTLVTVSVQASLPSLTLAQRLYRDASREEEIVRRASPRHPAFMPLTFKALSE
jgi:prophage DNA circulation protein